MFFGAAEIHCRKQSRVWVVACGKGDSEQRLFTCAVSRGLFQYSLHHDLGGGVPLLFEDSVDACLEEEEMKNRRRTSEEFLWYIHP